jgi:hypothetical protein
MVTSGLANFGLPSDASSAATATDATSPSHPTVATKQVWILMRKHAPVSMEI